ncbi:protein tramtrack, beta isoform-like isoform X2 [Scylla paramamosain]|uniref:protein tramtrack, beta isoform-like isoform X2 n=1 Tax=Scylla paramamosain TaxID=85552 RepID=UPI0030836ECF
MESEEHLNLRWNDHTLTFVHLLDHYRVQEQYCDARLACAGGGVYPVHKVVLSACSDFFASIFASDSCHNPVVVLQDVATEHLEALLTYVYRGEVLLARSDLPAFLKVAESLQVKGLAPPPLIPLSRDAWDSSVGVSDNGKHLSVHSHPPHHYKHLDSSQYPRSDAPSSSPVGCDGVWDGEGVRGSAAPLHTHHMARGSGKENGESVRPPRKRFSPHFGCTEQFGGTFRNLVASEEGDIKKEPQEEEEDENTDYLDTDSLTICEEEGEEAEMDDEVMKEEHDELTKERENEQRRGERVAEEAKHEGEQRTQQEVMEKEEEDDKEGRKDEGRHEDRREAEEKQQIEVKIMLDTRQHPEIMSDGQEDNTPITPIPTATISSPPPFTTTTTNKTHHLLVTTQPTYRARLPPPPPSTAVPLSPYHSTPCQYKNLQVLDTDAPLNLSQDTQQGQNRTQQAHSTHRHRASHQERQREGDPFLGKILTNRKRRLRGPKSWEYLVRLLRDPSTNPSLIRWENEAKGVFRLVQPAAIAQRWGRRTGKHASECLTYENFARGLRYHYATGALEPVSERSFVYKFGPKAHLVLGDGDWRVLTGETTVTSAGAVATRT